MLCDNCKKNEATIHIKEVHGTEIHTVNLCAACAAEKEKNGELDAFGFNLAEVLFNIGKSIEKATASDPAKESEPDEKKESALNAGPNCPVCGWTLEKLRKSGGRLGCPSCYQAFSPLIDEALTRIQRGTVHVGKRPHNIVTGNIAALQFELEERKRELNDLIRREEYEAAAVCRDQINRLKTELEAGEVTHE